MHGRKRQRRKGFAIRIGYGTRISLMNCQITSLQQMERLTLLPLSKMPSDDFRVLVTSTRVM